jgi:hypothetical protein
MNTARAILVIVLALIAGLVGYQLGIAQNIAALPAASGAPVAYAYGPHWFGWGWGFFPFFGFLFPLLFFFLIFALIRAAFWGGHGGGGRYWGRYGRFEEMHRELHGEKPQGDGPSSTAT